MVHVLLLGGSGKTAPTAHALQVAAHRLDVYWSRAPMAPDLPVAAALRGGLTAADAVIDCTHPFDETLRRIARGLAPDLPWARAGRPLWSPEPGDRWHNVADVADVVTALPAHARVFAATGRDSAEVLAHHDGPVYLRQLQRHADAAPSGCTFIFGDGPFDVAGEAALLQELSIDVVVARNTGGAAAFPKVAAARVLGLPVIMLTPPDLADRPVLDTHAAVLDWLAAL